MAIQTFNSIDGFSVGNSRTIVIDDLANVSANSLTVSSDANILATTASTSKTTGALKVAGGLGVAGTLYNNRSVTQGAYGNIILNEFTGIYNEKDSGTSLIQTTTNALSSGVGIQVVGAAGNGSQLYSTGTMEIAIGVAVRSEDVPTGGTVIASVASTGVSVTGNISATGNIVATNIGNATTILAGDGGLISNISGGGGTSNTIANGNSNVTIPTANGNIIFNRANLFAGQISQTSVSLGNAAGNSSQGIRAVAIGEQAGQTTQGSSSVAIGRRAGQTTQGSSSVAIGVSAGSDSQGITAVAIGSSAGSDTQGLNAVAVGYLAALSAQSGNAVAVGAEAGRNTQGEGAVAIGPNAGRSSQGANAIAIGSQAGNSSQPANSIVINATGVQLNGTNSGFYIAPVRNDTGNTTNVIYYNTTTNEVTYGPGGGGSTYGDANVSAYLASNTNTAGYQTTGNITALDVTADNITAVTAITNSRIVTRVESITTAPSLTPDGDTTDQYEVTALAVGTTINAPAGTPNDGQRLIIRIDDNGSAQTLAWDAIYRVVGTTLPTTTVAGKTLYVGCVYNTNKTKWDVIALSQEA